MDTKRRQRWIRVGWVTSGWYVFLQQWGVPDGLFFSWAGRVSWCQPCEFLQWRSLLWAVRHRLLMAGLQPVAMASGWPRRDRWSQLWVLVQRTEKVYERRHL